MPTYHRSQRLKLVGAGPRVEQLQNDRYRLTFQCEATNPREAWMFGNKSQIFASYGTLSTAQMSIAGIDRRTNEAYTDAVLVATEATPTEDNMIVTLVYETLGTSFVQVKDDTIDFDLNGLQRVTRESIAKVGTSFSKSIGSTAVTVDGVNCVLASLNVDNTDSYVKLIEVYLEEGTVLETTDNVGSQQAKVIETFGGDPSIPAGYSIANKEESNFQGYQTNRFTFLKDNVELSRVNDFVGSQLAITRTFYNPTSDPTESGYTVARKEQTDFEGIETIQYTFLKDNVTLSQSEDKVGSQLAIVKEVYNGTPSTPSGYSIAREEESEVDGIPTRRFTFLKNGVTLSTSEDKVGSQLAIVKEVFNGTPSTPSAYSIAREEVSEVDGIPTRRFTFLKNDTVLSRSRDSIGSQKAVVLEIFNGTNDTAEANGYGAGSSYVLAREEESDVGGIITKRYTYLQPSVLSVQESRNSLQKTVVVRVFNLTSSDSSFFSSGGSIVDSDTHLLVASNEEDFAGVKTSLFTYESRGYNTKSTNEFGRTVIEQVEQTDIGDWSLQDQSSTYTVDSVSNLRILNQTVENNDNEVNRRLTTFTTVGIDEVREELVGSQRAIVITKVGTAPTTTDAADNSNDGSDSASDFILIRDENNRVNGIDIFTYTFARKNAVVSQSEDKVGSQLAIIKEVFDGTPTTPSGYVIAREDTSDVDGIATKRFTFLKPSVLQSEELFQVSQNRVRVTAFNLDSATVKSLVSSVTDSHYLLSTSTSDFEGIETFVYTFDKSSIIDVRPITKSNFSLVEAYQYTSENASPATLHAASALELPDGTSLDANATFLEASVDSSSKPSIFSQIALNTSSAFDGSTPLLIHQYDTSVPFTYPGTVDTEVQGTETSGSDQDISVSLVLEGPVRTEVQATVFEFLQSSANLLGTDYSYDSAEGLWSPNQWASIKASGTIAGDAVGNESRFNDSQDFRGYRTVNSGTLVNVVAGADCNRLYYNGVLRLRDLEDSDDCLFTITAVEQGPPDPVGSKWVLDLDIQPIYSLSDGTTIYKKTIVVSDRIPLQISNDVPYNGQYST